jgi:DNA-binding FadR family transcriptional regulator
MPASKATRIAESLRERIMAEEWPDSGMLPNERDLSRSYGVARNTIRRALGLLVDQGMLTRHVGRGTVVRRPAAINHGDLDRVVRQFLRISPLDLMNMRLILEPQAAAAAALAAGDAEIAALHRVHAESSVFADGAALDRLDWTFHGAVAAATRNALLVQLHALLNALAEGFLSEALGHNPSVDETARILRQHRAILDAIEARDPEAAAEAMKQHLSVPAGLLLTGGTSLGADVSPAAEPRAQAPSPPDRTQRLVAIMEQISGTSPLDIMVVRHMIEPQVAAVAAAIARQEDLDRIREAHHHALAATEMAAFEHWDRLFHRRVFESTRNDFLKALHEVLYVIRSRERWIHVKRRAFSEERRLCYCEEHEAICQAITSRNTMAAAAAMRRHMRTVSLFLFGR